MMIIKPLYHLEIPEDYNAKYAIIPGDPGRVSKIAEFLDDAKFVCENREFKTYIGKIEGENVFVTSTGIGGASAAIAVEELSLLGVKNIVRIGTCGGMQMQIKSGDLIIATAAVRMEGTSKEYAPIEFPAVADFDVTWAIACAAKKSGKPYHMGVVQSKDSFYGQHSPERMPVGYELIDKWEAWKKCGCLASEMETAAIYTVSNILKIKAGCVLMTVWNQERETAGLDNPNVSDTTDAVKTAVEAIRNLINN